MSSVASSASGQVSPYEAAWNQFVIELRSFASEAYHVIMNLSTGEKVLGMVAFIMVLMLMIVMTARKKGDPGSNSRQFTGALLLVVLFAFGAGWTLDGGAGSLSHIFGR